MNVPSAPRWIVAALAGMIFAAPAEACRFCRPSGEYDRYAPDDPMSAFAPDAAAIARGQESGAPPAPAAVPALPKADDIVTSRAALMQAVATAPAAPLDAPAAAPGSYRARLIPPAQISAPAGTMLQASAAVPASGLSSTSTRVLDGTLVAAVLGVLAFFLRRSRGGREEPSGVMAGRT